MKEFSSKTLQKYMYFSIIEKNNLSLEVNMLHSDFVCQSGKASFRRGFNGYFVGSNIVRVALIKGMIAEHSNS